MAAHREWTERHIRELIQGELKRLKPPSGGGEGWPYCINIAQLLPNAEQTGNFGLLSDMYIKKLYLIKENEDTYRAEACFAAPNSYLYQTFPNLFTVDGSTRIFGMMGCNIDASGLPYYPLPVLERIDDEGNLHYLTPYVDGNIYYPYALLRTEDESVTAKFALGIVTNRDMSALNFNTKAFGTTSYTPNLACLVPIAPPNDSFQDWGNYDSDYVDPLFPLGRTNYASHTVCFTYKDRLAGVTTPQEGNYRTITAISTTGVNNSVETII